MCRVNIGAPALSSLFRVLNSRFSPPPFICNRRSLPGLSVSPAPPTRDNLRRPEPNWLWHGLLRLEGPIFLAPLEDGNFTDNLTTDVTYWPEFPVRICEGYEKSPGKVKAVEKQRRS